MDRFFGSAKWKRKYIVIESFPKNEWAKVSFSENNCKNCYLIHSCFANFMCTFALFVIYCKSSCIVSLAITEFVNKAEYYYCCEISPRGGFNQRKMRSLHTLHQWVDIAWRSIRPPLVWRWNGASYGGSYQGGRREQHQRVRRLVFRLRLTFFNISKFKLFPIWFTFFNCCCNMCTCIL